MPGTSFSGVADCGRDKSDRDPAVAAAETYGLDTTGPRLGSISTRVPGSE